MSITALSTAGFSQYIAASSNVSASQQALQSLQQSVASGNLTAAQAAFNTYQQLNQTLATASGSSSSSSSSASSSSSSATTSQLSKDMTALGTAIGAGNLSKAQSAFATVQGDLQTTPSQAITNAESAVAQTVQWVEDILNISGSNNSSTTPLDPTTNMLDSAYGLSTSSTATNPTTALLESKYGAGASATSASSSGSGSSTTSTATTASSGNAGNSASVNAYA